jgi:hypothetical protein
VRQRRREKAKHATARHEAEPQQRHDDVTESLLIGRA